MVIALSLLLNLSRYLALEKDLPENKKKKIFLIISGVIRRNTGLQRYSLILLHLLLTLIKRQATFLSVHCSLKASFYLLDSSPNRNCV